MWILSTRSINNYYPGENHEGETTNVPWIIQIKFLLMTNAYFIHEYKSVVKLPRALEL